MVLQFDLTRRLQGDALALLGLGPAECGYRIIASGIRWRLRAYESDARQPLLIVAAPIKRPYIWDLAPAVSAIRRCLKNRLRVYLLEWLPPDSSAGDAGLEDYAGRAIEQAVAECSQDCSGSKPILAGHSLGGTFAAIFAAASPTSVRGLVLLSSPLCFAPGSSPFRDALVAIAPALSGMDVVPGTFLSQLSAIASPGTFVWARLIDASLSIGDLRALEIDARVERWSLDELPLAGRLVDETYRWLYREDRFCAGTLFINRQRIGPQSVQVPVLAVINAADDIAPRGSILPFLNRMPDAQTQLLEYPGENGVGFPHLGLLIGRHAHASIWPQILSWIHARA